jgi:hypothetical protein
MRAMVGLGMDDANSASVMRFGIQESTAMGHLWDVSCNSGFITSRTSMILKRLDRDNTIAAQGSNRKNAAMEF